MYISLCTVYHIVGVLAPLTINMEEPNKTFHINFYDRAITVKPPGQPGDPINFGASTTSDVSMQELCNKPILVGSYNWTTGSGETLYPFPFLYTPDNNYYGRMLQMYALFRNGLRFRVKLNGSPFHSGALIMAWHPADAYVSTTSATTLSSKLVLGHQMINASNSEEMILEVPWRLPYLALYSKGQQTPPNSAFGSLSIQPWIGLRLSGGSTAQLTATIYVEPMNVVLRVPTPYILPPLMEQNMRKAREEYWRSRLTEGVVHQSGLIHMATPTIKKLVGSIPIVGDFIAGFLDKPYEKNMSHALIPRATGGLTWGEGPNDSATLSVTPGLLRGAYVDEIGETPVNHWSYAKIPGLLETGTFSIATAAGAMITQQRVAPLAKSYTFGNIFGGIPTYMTEHTPISYATMPYTWWRGGIDFIFSIFATQMTTGTIAIVWIPNTHHIDPTTNYSAVASITNTQLIEFRGPTSKKITIPYVGPEYCKCVPNPNWIGKIGSANGWLYCCCGSIGVFLVNTVVCPDGAPTVVDYTIQIAGSDDFDFGYMAPDTIGSILASNTAVVAEDPANKINSDIFQALQRDQSEVQDHAQAHGLDLVGFKPRVGRLGASDVVHQTGTVPQDQGLPVGEINKVEEPEQESTEMIATGNQPLSFRDVFGESHRDTYANLKGYSTLFSFYVPPENITTGSSVQSLWLLVPVTPNIVASIDQFTIDPINPNDSTKKLPNHLWFHSQMAAFWRGSISYKLVIPPAYTGVWKVRFYPRKPWASTSTGSGTIPFGNTTSVLWGHIPSTSDAAQRGTTNRHQMSALWSGSTGVELQTRLVNGVLSFTVPFWDPRPMAPITRTNLRVGTMGGVAFADNMIGNIVITCNNLVVREAFTTTGTAWFYPIAELMFAAGDDFMLSTPVPPPLTWSNDYFQLAEPAVDHGSVDKFETSSEPAKMVASPARAESRPTVVVKRKTKEETVPPTEIKTEATQSAAL